MPYVKRGTDPFTHFRLLLSGLSKTGKTTSLPTFIYGQYNPYSEDEEERLQAQEYAGQRTLVILTCPGETGYRSLPTDNEHITSYYVSSEEPCTVTAEYSTHVLHEFFTLHATIMQQHPDVLAWDGIHWLHNHILNKASNGEFLAGQDMNLDASNRNVQYRAARFYNQARHNFGELLARVYASPIPMFVATVWEKWEEVAEQTDRPDVASKRYYWPDISGEMSIKIIGMFDARLSCRQERMCLHTTCEDSKQNQLHHVWQFYPRGDVKGVGINGLTLTPLMRNKPFIHQNGDYLREMVHMR